MPSVRGMLNIKIMSLYNWITVVGVIITVAPLVRMGVNYQLKNRIYNFLIGFLGATLLALSYCKNKKDGLKEAANDKVIQDIKDNSVSIKDSTGRIITILRTDSLTNMVFQNAIKDSLHIIKDAITGKPIDSRKYFNNTIDKVETLNQY